MKPAAIRYITLLGIFLLGSAAMWGSLLEAKGKSVPTSRIMQFAQLFEQQGRLGKAAELYRRVLASNPRHVQARLRLERLTRNAQAVLSQPTLKPVAEVTLVQAVKPGPQAKTSGTTAGMKEKVSEQPELSSPKNQNALSQANDKSRGLIPGFAVSQPKENAENGVSEAAGKAVAVSVAAKAAQEEKARLAAKAVQEEKARLAEKAAREEKARLAAKAAQEKQQAVSAISQKIAGPVEVLPVSESRPGGSETRKILGRVGKRIQEVVPEPAPKRPDFEEMGVVPPKPQIPEHLKRNGLAETSPSLRRPVQKLDENGQPVPAEKPVAASDGNEPIQPMPETGVLSKTQKALAKAKERVGGLLPRIPARSQKLRKDVASNKTKRPKGKGTPLWKLLRGSLAKAKGKVSSKLVRKTEQVVIDETLEAPENDAAEVSPVEVVRGGQIPPLTVSEQIEDAGNRLKANSGDPAARMTLIGMVDSAPDFEASLAAYTLGTRAKGHADIMAALGHQLRLRGGVAKVHMAEAMLRLDGNHVTATDALLKLSASEDKRVRMMAAFSMQSATKTQKERCIAALIKVLKDSDSDVRASAALALGAYGPEAKRAIPAIVTVIHDVDPGTARAAGVALQCVVRNSLDSKTIRPVAAEAVGGK
ncbi:MAG: HEAT repeat domain-containing protein [Planctomycetota bacterium]|nr:HEAT repeat domain-containing protein [Planctomycetota bacterium]